MSADRTVVPSGEVPDLFDRMLAGLIGRPDVVSTKTSTRQVVPPLGIGGVSTYVIRTFRVQEEGQSGQDILFLECYDSRGQVRLCLPSAVTEIIARQRDSLSTQSRTKAARRVAADRKARGEVPAFLKGKGKR